MQHHIHSSNSNVSATDDEPTAPHVRDGKPDAYTRAIAALTSKEVFTREQAAWLMSLAMRWGYELRDEEAEESSWTAGYDARVAEENAWAEEILSFSAKDLAHGARRQWLRAQYDALLSRPRIGDYRGGPVAWDESEELRVAA